MQNTFNNCMYNPQSAQPLQLSFQQNPPPQLQTNMLNFITPPHQALSYVQLVPSEVQQKWQKMSYEPPTLIFLGPQPMSIELPTLYPPVSKAPECQHAVSRVDMMDVEQTGNWIRTLGKDKAWMEAETYSKSFKENCITGDILRRLTHKLLEFDLGMTNQSHRIELLRIIQLLYPQNTGCEGDCDRVPHSINTTPTKIFECPSEVVNNDLPPRARYDCISILNQLVQPKHSNRSSMDTESESSYTLNNISTCSTNGVGPVYMECTPVLDSGYEAHQDKSCSPKQERSYAKVVLGSSKDGLSMPGMRKRKSECVAITKNYNDPKLQKREEIGSNRSTRRGRYSSRYRKLIVTLRPDQRCQDNIAIRRRFTEFDFVVDSVEKWQESDSTYLVVFLNSDKARDAYQMADDLGYNLKRQWPDRPNPRRPIKYISNRKLLIREGKALSGKKVGELSANEIVTVNQVKGRRARLIKVVDGVTENIGWVSLSTEDGFPLLEQVSEVSSGRFHDRHQE